MKSVASLSVPLSSCSLTVVRHGRSTTRTRCRRRSSPAPQRRPTPDAAQPAQGVGKTRHTEVQYHAVVGTVSRRDGMDWVVALGQAGRAYPLGGPAHGVAEGACVIADLSDGPQQVAQVREVLPGTDSLRNRIFAIAADHGVRFGFSRAALAEIEARRAAPPPRGVDLTDKPFITIDNPTTRVMDQAIHIERQSSGYLLRYAIADATWLIPPGSATSAEACERSASLYLPCDPPATLGEAIAMLDPGLGDMMGSVIPDAERPAFVATVHLDRQGEVLQCNFARGTVKSRAKLCFAEVQAYYDSGAGDLAKAPFTDSLNLIRELGQILEQRATERGVLDLNHEGPRLGLKAGSDHELEVQDPSGNRAIDRYNAQVSILVNQQVGEALAKAKVAALWRVQEPPAKDRLQHLRTALQQLGRPWRQGMPLSRYVANLQASDPKTPLAKLLILQHSHTAHFSTEPVGHDALKLAHYSQFTAPMRRYPDVVVHHLLSALVEHRTVPYQDDGGAALRAVVRHADAFHGRERAVLRQVDALFAAAALQPLIDASLQGVVVGVRPQIGTVEIVLSSPPVHVQTPLKDGPRLQVGDAVNVTVQDANVTTATVDVRVDSTRHPRRAA